MRNQNQSLEEMISKNVKARDEQEFHEKLILGETKSNFGELGPMVPTGFLNEEEIKLSKDQQEMASFVRFIEERMGVNLDEIKKDIFSTILFNSHISKGRNGFGVKMANTDILRQDQSVYQSMNEDEKEGLLDKLKGIFGKASKKGDNVGLGQIGNDINYGSYGRKRKWR